MSVDMHLFGHFPYVGVKNQSRYGILVAMQHKAVPGTKKGAPHMT